MLQWSENTANGILNEARHFRSFIKCLMEFLWNSYEYCDEKRRKIRITLQGRNLIIADNGRGMSVHEIEGIFLNLHEHVELGSTVKRNKFGTGAKGAGCALCDKMLIETVKNGLENSFHIDWKKLRTSKSLKGTLVEETVNRKVSKANGTRITCFGLRIQPPAKADIVDAISSRMRSLVNEHLIVCQESRITYTPPAIVSSKEFAPDSKTAALIGNVKMKVFVSAEELKKDHQGVWVSCNGIPFELYGANLASSPYKHKIFAQVDAPLLDFPDANGTFATDGGREMRLSDDNLRVKALHDWITECTDAVSKELSENDSYGELGGWNSVCETLSACCNSYQDARLASSMPGRNKRVDPHGEDSLDAVDITSPGPKAGTVTADGTDIIITLAGDGGGGGGGGGGDGPGQDIKVATQGVNTGTPGRGTKVKASLRGIRFKPVQVRETSVLTYPMLNEGLICVNLLHPSIDSLKSFGQVQLSVFVHAAIVAFAAHLAEHDTVIDDAERAGKVQEHFAHISDKFSETLRKMVRDNRIIQSLFY